MPICVQRCGTPGPSGAEAVGKTTTRAGASRYASKARSTGSIEGLYSPAPTRATVPLLPFPMEDSLMCLLLFLLLIGVFVTGGDYACQCKLSPGGSTRS